MENEEINKIVPMFGTIKSLQFQGINSGSPFSVYKTPFVFVWNELSGVFTLVVGRL